MKNFIVNNFIYPGHRYYGTPSDSDPPDCKINAEDFSKLADEIYDDDLDENIVYINSR